jgi:hypothetical protein
LAVNYVLLHVLTTVDGDVGAGDEDCLIPSRRYLRACCPAAPVA